MGKNIVKEKSFDFAVSIVYLYKELTGESKEFVMSKQLLRSGTSIGANIREAEFAISRRDFATKMSISLKEANETDYWLDLLCETDYIDKEKYQQYHPKIKELIKLLVSIVKSSKGDN